MYEALVRRSEWFMLFQYGSNEFANFVWVSP